MFNQPTDTVKYLLSSIVNLASSVVDPMSFVKYNCNTGIVILSKIHECFLEWPKLSKQGVIFIDTVIITATNREDLGPDTISDRNSLLRATLGTMAISNIPLKATLF